MDNDFKYHLQKYAGTRSRHICPSCGRKGEFTLYVDENNVPLNELVGRCNRESDCGYHYTPAQFFHDHPECKPQGEDWRKAPDWLKDHQPKPKPLCLVPPEIVSRSVTHRSKSQFVRFLDTVFDPLIVEGLIDEYRLGTTRSGAVIFFQLDIQGRCRTGKMMLYDPETGHRIKDKDKPGRIDWVHSLMKRTGMLPQDWEVTQCLFGEHLLRLNPRKPVALVESEKTAVICAGLMPQFLWLATGGKSQLKAEKFAVLGSRKITAFPDVDGFTEWTQKLKAIPGLNVTVADVLQRHATPEDFKAQIDIADWLLRTRCRGYCHSERSPQGGVEESPRHHSRTFLDVAKYFSPEAHAELEALIDDLGLEFYGKVERVEVEEDLPP